MKCLVYIKILFLNIMEDKSIYIHSILYSYNGIHFLNALGIFFRFYNLHDDDGAIHRYCELFSIFELCERTPVHA